MNTATGPDSTTTVRITWSDTVNIEAALTSHIRIDLTAWYLQQQGLTAYPDEQYERLVAEAIPRQVETLNQIRMSWTGAKRWTLSDICRGMDDELHAWDNR